MGEAGRILRYARLRAGLSQRELAAAAGIPQPAIARIERGGTSPRLDTLERLLAATSSKLELMPRLGIGIDRSLIQAQLELTPADRIRAAGVAAQNLAAFTAAIRREPRG